MPEVGEAFVSGMVGGACTGIGVATDDGSLEGRNRFYNAVWRGIAAKHLLKLRAVILKRVELGGYFVRLRAHVRSRPGSQRLFLE